MTGRVPVAMAVVAVVVVVLFICLLAGVRVMSIMINVRAVQSTCTRVLFSPLLPALVVSCPPMPRE